MRERGRKFNRERVRCDVTTGTGAMWPQTKGQRRALTLQVLWFWLSKHGLHHCVHKNTVRAPVNLMQRCTDNLYLFMMLYSKVLPDFFHIKLLFKNLSFLNYLYQIFYRLVSLSKERKGEERKQENKCASGHFFLITELKDPVIFWKSLNFLFG